MALLDLEQINASTIRAEAARNCAPARVVPVSTCTVGLAHGQVSPKHTYAVIYSWTYPYPSTSNMFLFSMHFSRELPGNAIARKQEVLFKWLKGLLDQGEVMKKLI